MCHVSPQLCAMLNFSIIRDFNKVTFFYYHFSGALNKYITLSRMIIALSIIPIIVILTLIPNGLLQR